MPNTTPLVSIAIPTYNRADSFLKGAIECALKQTYENIELIISDNCSSDNTEEVVKQFQDPRIIYTKQKANIGPNNNFNYCLSQAQGDYFLLLLDDDRIDPDFIDTCIRAANYDRGFGIIRTGTRLIDENDRVMAEKSNTGAGLSSKDFYLAWFTNKLTLFLCSTLFNTSKLKAIGGFKSKHCLFQDVMAQASLISTCKRVDIAEIKASFRRHTDNFGSPATKVMLWCEDSLDLLNLICELEKNHENILRNAGMPFFCKMNYIRASNISSPVKRLATYHKIARIFQHSSSPFIFAYQQDIRPKLRHLVKSIQHKN